MEGLVSAYLTLLRQFSFWGIFIQHVYRHKIEKNEQYFEVTSTGSMQGSWLSVGGNRVSLRRWPSGLKYYMDIELIRLVACSYIHFENTIKEYSSFMVSQVRKTILIQTALTRLSKPTIYRPTFSPILHVTLYYNVTGIHKLSSFFCLISIQDVYLDAFHQHFSSSC